MDNPGESQRMNGEDDTAECKDSQQTVLQWCRDNSYGHLETSAKGEVYPMNTLITGFQLLSSAICILKFTYLLLSIDPHMSLLLLL